MSLKGTLETLNLRELLQMLAFNQKDGTLVLETESGPRTVVLAGGKASFASGDRHASQALARCLRRTELVPGPRLEEAMATAQEAGVFLGELLRDQRLLEPAQVDALWAEAAAEALFDLQIGRIQRFEFVEGVWLAPDGQQSRPVEPGLQVDALLLELTRKVDTWNSMTATLPSLAEMFEGTGSEVDLGGVEDLDPLQAQRVVEQIDGFHDLSEVAERSAVSRYVVMQVAVALLQGGAIRPVPTEDLVARAEDRLSRGEASAALNLLRRAMERSDAPYAARLRMADALEATGDAIGAAAQLDACAAEAPDGQEVEVFGSLLRAVRLREGDPSSAGRACDHYLRHRDRLRAQRSEALDALRTLIHGAVALGRPLEAAQRLHAFLEANEAPSEDLMVLADLYASGGDVRGAAAALARRADDLLAVQRISAARDCLTRALKLDPSRNDVRLRLSEMDGQARRAAHRKRVQGLLVLLCVLVAGAGGGWWWMQRQARIELQATLEEAFAALGKAEAEATRKADAFRKHVKSLEGSPDMPGDLRDRAQQVLAELQVLAEGPRNAVNAHAHALAEQARGADGLAEAAVQGLEQRRSNILRRLEPVQAEIKKGAESSLQAGEEAFRAGLFRKAQGLLLAARNTAYEDEAVREQAARLLRNVEKDIERCAALKAEIDADREAGDLESSARKALAGLVEMLDNDLTREFRVPVALESAPPGAEVLLGGKPTTLVTPCVLTYSPFEDTLVVLRMPGRTAASIRLPTYADVKEGAVTPAAFSPRIRRELPEGPLWVLKDPQERRILAAWTSLESTPIVLLDDGLTTGPVDPRSGLLGATITAKQANTTRKGGTWAVGADWRIQGQRTLRVKPGGGTSWEVQVLGRLERAPALHESTVCVVDEQGTLYGYQLATGQELWRRELSGAPAQAPYATARGFVISTIVGGATLHAARTGEATNLAAAGRGLTLAVPHGDGILLLGTGEEGIRRLGPKGAPVTLGTASPALDVEPACCEQGVAWAASDAVWWLPVGSTTPVRLEALGGAATHVAADALGVVAAGRDKVLRAVLPSAPASLRWAAPLGEAPRGPLLVTKDAVYVLAGSALVAVER